MTPLVDQMIDGVRAGSWLSRWLAAGRPAFGTAQKTLSRHLAARSREGDWRVAALVARVSQ
jgi:hypothetical protein